MYCTAARCDYPIIIFIYYAVVIAMVAAIFFAIFVAVEHVFSWGMGRTTLSERERRQLDVFERLAKWVENDLDLPFTSMLVRVTPYLLFALPLLSLRLY